MLGKTHAFCSKPVYMGGVKELLTVHAKIGIAGIISQHVDDVGGAFFNRLLAGREEQKTKERSKTHGEQQGGN